MRVRAFQNTTAASTNELGSSSPFLRWHVAFPLERPAALYPIGSHPSSASFLPETLWVRLDGRGPGRCSPVSRPAAWTLPSRCHLWLPPDAAEAREDGPGHALPRWSGGAWLPAPFSHSGVRNKCAEQRLWGGSFVNCLVEGLERACSEALGWVPVSVPVGLGPTPLMVPVGPESAPLEALALCVQRWPRSVVSSVGVQIINGSGCWQLVWTALKFRARALDAAVYCLQKQTIVLCIRSLPVRDEDGRQEQWTRTISVSRVGGRRASAGDRSPCRKWQ